MSLPSVTDPPPQETAAAVSASAAAPPAAPPGFALASAPAPVAPPGPPGGGGRAAAVRRAAVPLGVLGAVAAAFAYVGAVDPDTPGHYPACPLLTYTGVYCPGCGGLRSAHAVVHGHFGTALGCNALAVAGYVLFAVFWAVWFVRELAGRPLRPSLGRAHWWCVWGVMAAFTVVRNLPFGAALSP